MLRAECQLNNSLRGLLNHRNDRLGRWKDLGGGFISPFLLIASLRQKQHRVSFHNQSLTIDQSACLLRGPGGTRHQAQRQVKTQDTTEPHRQIKSYSQQLTRAHLQIDKNELVAMLRHELQDTLF